MKASTEPVQFVARGAGAGVEVLPQTLTELTGRCAITIELADAAPQDVSSWYDIWQAAVALDGMCARGSMVGTARLLGAGRRLSVGIRR